MDGGFDIALDRPLLVHGLSDDVKDASSRAGSDGDHDGGACVLHLLTSDQALSSL